MEFDNAAATTARPGCSGAARVDQVQRHHQDNIFFEETLPLVNEKQFATRQSGNEYVASRFSFLLPLLYGPVPERRAGALVKSAR